MLSSIRAFTRLTPVANAISMSTISSITSTSPHVDDKKNVLIVGGGLTGCVTAYLLSQQDRYNLSIWDKARGVGGRMSTRRYPEGQSQVDLGAQYISASPDYQESHSSFYSALSEAGVLQPLRAEIQGMRAQDGKTTHYVAPGGVSQLVKHFLNNSAADFSRSRRVVSVNQSSQGVSVESEDGHSEVFDAVVLTVPVPQLLELKGNVVSSLEPAAQNRLEQVSYSSRYALALFYPSSTDIAVPWAAKYVRNSDVVFMSLDQRKRSVDTVEGTALMVHTSVPFGIANIDNDKETVLPLIWPQIQALIPGLTEPQHVHTQKWRYSQVHRAYEGAPGAITLSEGVYAAGDSFTHSNFDGCVESALRAVSLMED